MLRPFGHLLFCQAWTDQGERTPQDLDTPIYSEFGDAVGVIAA